MRTLGFQESEVNGFFKGIAVILLLGNIELQGDAQGQAQFKDLSQVTALCTQLGVDAEAFGSALLNPVMRAGGEHVAQGRDVEQVARSLEALSRTLYERVFTRLVARINSALSANSHCSTPPKPYAWIGVLDIAGFEIFEENSFEQLCVNYTNERLQQFFNHHMFTREQEEYAKERVDWQPVDFGLDLQPTIDLIERVSPIGLLACLDEDCVMPKATDRSYCEKVISLWRRKTEKFSPGRFGDAFSVEHYAGRVEYGTVGWLEKNRDPVNEQVAGILAGSSDLLLASLLQDDEDSGLIPGGRYVKKGQFRTVAQRYRESLALLMQQLGGTQPHFVRCIIPNGEKRPGHLEARLVLDQLKCNGVLEGIRICRLGFPTRLPYADFCRLYELLAKETLDTDRRVAAKQLLEQLEMPQESYRLGQTKVFFKAGELTRLEEQRNAKLASILSRFQSHCRAALSRLASTRLARQSASRLVLQRSIQRLAALRQWPWWRLYMRVKPLLNVTRAENRIEELEEECERLSGEREAQAAVLRAELEAERDKLVGIEGMARDLERQAQQLHLQLGEAQEGRDEILSRLAAAESDLADARAKKAALESENQTLRTTKDAEMAQLKADYEIQLEDYNVNMSRLKASLEAVQFEQSQLERSEASLRSRISHLEASLEEARQEKAGVEAKLRACEEARRELEDRLADDSISAEKQAEMQTAFEAQLRILKERHEEDAVRQVEDTNTLRLRFQRDILALTSDLESERKSCAALHATIRSYESGNAGLSSELEAERRAQEAWRREKERMEAQIYDGKRQREEGREREDQWHASLATANDTLKDLRGRIAQLEDESLGLERGKKQSDLKCDRQQELLAALQSELTVSHQKLASLESSLTLLRSRADESEDECATLKERLRLSDQITKVQAAQCEEMGRHLGEGREELRRTESQVKELQMKLMEVETRECTGDLSSLRLAPQTIASLTQIRAQLEEDSATRLSLLHSLRSKDRQVSSLQSQINALDTSLLSLQDSLSTSDMKARKLQSKVEQLEGELAEAGFVKRRAERMGEEEREACERVGREMERVKARLAAIQAGSQ